jgi:NitT/TauT family transport system substrate-binding protein
MGKKSLIAGWMLLAFFFACWQAWAASAPDKIKFPYSPISWNSLPWWMAKDAGHFEKNGLDVGLFYEGASSVIVQAMLAGEANFGGLAGPAVVSNVINGGDVIQIAAIVKTFTVPMFSAPNIKEVAQLKGQKVAVSRFGSISHIAAQNIFQKAGVTGAAVIQSGGTPESAAMLMSGAVAAAEFDAQGKGLPRARQRKAIPRMEHSGGRERRGRAALLCR